MRLLDTETLASLFLLPENLAVEAVYPTRKRLIIQVFCTMKSASCPLCQRASERIHGRYERTVADVPCGGRLVTLALTVRKFFCQTPDCPRLIFTERLPDLVQPSARMTNRLSEVLQTIGFATCGELGERLIPKLGMSASGPTLLRRMRTRSCPAPASVRILGIDDWSWKKGMTYGTILVDLELHKPIEILPDRSSETAEAWLRIHPEVELVSRDRGGEYAAAAKKGAPQAQQVADRFHLLQNLRERLKEVMDRKHTSLPEIEERPSDAIPAKARGMKEQGSLQMRDALTAPEQEKHYRTNSVYPNKRSEGTKYDDFQKQVRREKRIALYEDVCTLVEQGLSHRAIARKLKLARATVSNFAQAQAYPETHHPKRGERKSILDPYKGYVLHRWQQGCTNGAQLYDEIKARGYLGSEALLRMFLAELRKKHQEAGSASVLILNAGTQLLEIPPSLPPKPHITRRMSATRASWLFVSQAGKLNEKQKQHIRQMIAGHPDLARAYELSQSFVMMLAEHRGTDLDIWLTQAERSGLPEFKKMARGIRLDYAAVKAAFSSKWSQGQVEAQVNCLKLQKRIVFGRANFDLLRLRVLCRV
jgi:transposase